MSHQAIAAVLAREDLAAGERLVAFSLASFADRDARARPGTAAAAGRAGLAKSAYLEARERLVERSLVVVEQAASGRGRASTLRLPFAQAGPWCEGEINAELFETVLGYSRAAGSARLLLAAAAALANEQRVVEGVTTEQLCAAAGMADRTYRRARAALLASGELVLRSGIGGRGNTNCWEIRDPRSGDVALQPGGRRRVMPPAGARPLVATVPPAPPSAVADGRTQAGPAGGAGDLAAAGKCGQSRTVSLEKGPDLTGVSSLKGGQSRTVSAQKGPDLTGVSSLKGGQNRTISAETPAQTPAETPAPHMRAGSEPQNPRTRHPPNPPQGGSRANHFLVEETHVSERGRRRRRVVPVDLGPVRERLRAAGEEDLAAWEQARTWLRESVGESTFEIWLAALELIAVDVDGALIVAAPAQTVSWVARRFGRVLDDATAHVGRQLRMADEVEREAARPLAPAAKQHAADTRRAVSGRPQADGAAGRWAVESARQPSDTSTYTSSYTDVYNPIQEVS